MEQPTIVEIAGLVFQGSLGLLAVIGVFIVYRMQAQQQTVQQKVEAAAWYARDAFFCEVGVPIPVAGGSSDDVRESLRIWATKTEKKITEEMGGGVEDKIKMFRKIVEKAQSLQKDSQMISMLEKAVPER